MIAHVTRPRTYELLQDVSSFLEGTIDDWPTNIQDQIFAALEAKSRLLSKPLAIVYSRCGRDDVGENYYVHVIASEIIAVET